MKGLFRPPWMKPIPSQSISAGAELSLDGKKESARSDAAITVSQKEAWELSLLPSEIGSLVLSKRKSLTEEEQERIVRAVKAMVG